VFDRAKRFLFEKCEFMEQVSELEALIPFNL
jgi:hypothetical protein